MTLRFKVKPNSREERLTKEGDDLVVRVKAAAHEGKANKALIEFLAELLRIPKSRIQITGGLTSHFKRVYIPDEYNEKVVRFLEHHP